MRLAFLCSTPSRVIFGFFLSNEGPRICRLTGSQALCRTFLDFAETLGESSKVWFAVATQGGIIALLLFFAHPPCVQAQDNTIDAIVTNVLFRDDTPRDLGVVSPGKSLRVRIPIVNTLDHELFLAESSSSCLCTSVVPLKYQVEH